MSATLNPPSLAETINAKGFSHAAGFRIVAVEPGRAEVAVTRRDDLVQFFGHFHGGVISALADTGRSPDDILGYDEHGLPT